MQLDNPKIETGKLYFAMQFKIHIEAKRFHARILLYKRVATELKRFQQKDCPNTLSNKGISRKKRTEFSQG